MMRKFVRVARRVNRWAFSWGQWPINWAVGLVIYVAAVVLAVELAGWLWALALQFRYHILAAVLGLMVLVVVVWAGVVWLRERFPDFARRLIGGKKMVASEALTAAGVRRPNGDPARIKIGPGYGDGSFSVQVWTPAGATDEKIVDTAPAVLAAAFGAVVVSHDLTISRPGCPVFTVQPVDLLADEAMHPGGGTLTAVPLGVSDTGEAVTLSLDSQTVLVGGSPGAGKSVAVWSLILGACADPSVSLVLVDLKPASLDYAPIHSRAEILATTRAAARDAFRRIVAYIDETNHGLLPRGFANVRQVPEGAPRVLVVVDEAAQFTMGAATKEEEEAGKEALRLLNSIVAVGRASGVSVIIATQKPDSTVIPTGLRDLMAQRVAFRVGNRAQAETILGDVPAGVRPWKISGRLPGIGFGVGLIGPISEGRFRAYNLTDTARDDAAAQICAPYVAAGAPKILPPLPAVVVDDDPEGAPQKRRRRR